MTDVNQSELEPGQAVVDELERLVHHPRQEAQRLHGVADSGGSGAAPFIELGAVALRVVPFVLLMVAVMLGVYFAFR